MFGSFFSWGTWGIVPAMFTESSISEQSRSSSNSKSGTFSHDSPCNLYWFLGIIFGISPWEVWSHPQLTALPESSLRDKQVQLSETESITSSHSHSYGSLIRLVWGIRFVQVELLLRNKYLYYSKWACKKLYQINEKGLMMKFSKFNKLYWINNKTISCDLSHWKGFRCVNKSTEPKCLGHNGIFFVPHCAFLNYTANASRRIPRLNFLRFKPG